MTRKNTPQPHSDLPLVRPNIRFLLQHPAHFIALGLGSGLSPIAPGTAGTLFAWLSFNLISLFLSLATTSYFLWPLIIVLSFMLGLWACRVSAENMRIQDPGAIVWDEVVAFWLVLYSIPFMFPADPVVIQVAAFILFRLFDMVKIGPVRWADQKFKGAGYRNALGIMLDDIIAAILAITVIYLAYFLFTFFNHA
ncbi:MAG: phosphatidylglycerophosphatase A family protein [Saezia sp.]